MKYCILQKNDEQSSKIANSIRTKIHIEYDDNAPDIVVSVGGDGTFLRVIHKYLEINPNLIVFGIHTGHLGFFSNYSIDEEDDLVSAINDNKYSCETMKLINFEVKSVNEVIKGFALNEVTIVNPPRLLLLDVKIDGELLETYRGTGLCISTPYGSTAYNKSLHGSVVDPMISSIQLTEIAGINSNSYRSLSSPFVLNEKRKINLCSNLPLEIWVTVDNISYEIHDFLELNVFYGDIKVNVAYSIEQSFLTRIKRTFID